MIHIPRIRTAVAGFRKSENGSASVELLLMVPLLSFITFSMVTFFAAFRAETDATRAATVLTDMVSREDTPVTPEFLAGVEGLMKTLIRSDPDPEFRLTAFTYDADDKSYLVAWSKDTGKYGSMDNTDINDVSDRLPILKDGQRAILMETSVNYEPMLDIGLGTRTFENFNVSAPRFVAQLCYMESASADVETARC